MTASAAGRELGMAPKGKALEITLICAFFILLALWGIIWDITSGLLSSGIDGIMLLGVCVMMAGIFKIVALVHLNHAGIIPTPAFLQAKAKPTAAAAGAKAPATAATPAPAAAKAPAAAPKPAAPATSPAVPSATAPAAPKPAAPAAVPPAVPPPVPPKAPEE